MSASAERVAQAGNGNSTKTGTGNRGCDTYIEGVRLRIDDATYVYPDVMVTCEDNGHTSSDDYDEFEVSAPCLVGEVLSPSTSWVDHGRKRTA